MTLRPLTCPLLPFVAQHPNGRNGRRADFRASPVECLKLAAKRLSLIGLTPTPRGHRVSSGPAIRANVSELFTLIEAVQLPVAGPDPLLAFNPLDTGYSRQAAELFITPRVLLLTP